MCGTLESQLKKSLSGIAKKKDCRQVSLWIKAIINHLCWCCASSIGNEELIREKWASMLNHIRGIHSWGDKNHKCEHGQLDQERKWVKTDSPSFLALKNVVENKNILADIKYISKFCHTGRLEVFHSILNKYFPKRLHFTLEGMIVRTQLAVLYYNCGSSNTQATTKDGKQRYKIFFSKGMHSWVVKKYPKQKVRIHTRVIILTLEASPDSTGDKLPRTT